MAAPDFSVLAIVPNNLGDHEVVEGVVVGLAIQGIAGAAGRAVLLIWSARIMLYFSLSSGGITFRFRMSRRGCSRI